MDEFIENDCNVIHEDVVNNIKLVMPDDEMFIRTSNFFKVLGDKTRFKIIWAIEEGELCVCDIACLCNMTKSAISHQLALLKKEGFVKSKKIGKEVFYSLKDDHVKFILDNSIKHINERRV